MISVLTDAEAVPGHLIREKTSHLTSPKTIQLADAPGGFFVLYCGRKIEREVTQLKEVNRITEGRRWYRSGG